MKKSVRPAFVILHKGGWTPELFPVFPFFTPHFGGYDTGTTNHPLI